MNNKISLALSATITALAITVPAMSSEIKSTVDSSKVSQSRQTPFGLYLSPIDAYVALIANPSIVLIDVRDPVEVSFIGHPSFMDSNIPLATISDTFDPQTGGYILKDNKHFVSQVKTLMERLGYSKTDMIIVSCRSGPRAAKAAALLHEAGFTRVWNQIEGFEGSANLINGVRKKNGWRNAGLPWRYRIKRGTEWQQNLN